MLRIPILAIAAGYLAFAAPSAWAADKDNRTQAFEWIRDNNNLGKVHQLVTDAKKFLDSPPEGKSDFLFELGAGLTKSGKATWVLGWRGKFFAKELSGEQAKKIDRDAMSKTALNPQDDLGAVKPDFELKSPEFDGGAKLAKDKEITGKLPFKNLGRETNGYPSIRLTYWQGNERHTTYSHYKSKFVGKDDKFFSFKFPAPDVNAGPVLFIFDIVEYFDDARTGKGVVTSDPIVALVDITVGKGAAAAKPVKGTAVKGLVTDKNDGKFVELVDNVMFVTNREYFITKFPKEMAGGHVLVRPNDQSADWPKAGRLTMEKTGMVYVAILMNADGREMFTNRQLVSFFNEGWKLAEGKFEATSVEGEDWKWQVLRIKVDKGPFTLTLPKGIEKLGTAIVFVFK